MQVPELDTRAMLGVWTQFMSSARYNVSYGYLSDPKMRGSAKNIEKMEACVVKIDLPLVVAKLWTHTIVCDFAIACDFAAHSTHVAVD